MYLKKLREQRSAKVKRMQEILAGAKGENRAMSEEEQKEFDDTESEIADLDKTIAAAEKAKELEAKETDKNHVEDPDKDKEGQNSQEGQGGENRAEDDKRAFADYIRGVITGENRADMTLGENGAVIPSTIANEIIKKIKDISPVYNDAAHYNVKGTLSIPYVDEDGTSLAVAYADEFAELEGEKEKFASIELGGFLAGVLAKISKSLINNSDFDIVEEVETQIAEAFALWLDHEMLVGTVGKITGASTSTKKIQSESTSVISFDDIIKLKDAIKAAHQTGAYFVMRDTTLTAIRLLKDKNGRYLVNDDVTEEGKPTILGKPVYTSDAMPEIGKGSEPIVYLNPSKALAVKLTEDMELQVLQEKYATQHVVGVVGWTEVDAKIKNQQAIASLKMAEA
jgi:HK97 family phage major capsid protein|nr:MAG TPA: major capsid protein [Caudoviricetes sp.]